ncbi:hypothetical protein GCM10010964_13880 [Caldovatus sediminis]|uniref:Sulphotransferase Stf0 domain-containing protein n=1 Tax=Caldovatus sediminis TaxID=2041189 RepID=A0A8J3EBI6_9PROT|nr:hypothetical protein [Caldovatus sediminis]GGG27190.1 hypothetical protein GCM10010964_13880 [Caldovatus sediminis]
MRRHDNVIVTLATQRSGTKFLGTALGNGERVASFGEVFQPGRPAPSFGRFFARHLAGRESFAFSGPEMFECLDAFFAELHEAAAGRAFVHVDVMYNNLGALTPIWARPMSDPHDNFLLNYFKSRGMVLLHLLRRDLADCYASHVIAESRGIYHTGDDRANAEAVSVTLDAAAAVAYLHPILKARRYVRRALAGYPRALEVEYPGFIAGPTVAPELAERLGALLRLPGEARAGLFGASPLRPTASDKARMVTNYEEIRRLAAELERLVADD